MKKSESRTRPHDKSGSQESIPFADDIPTEYKQVFRVVVADPPWDFKGGLWQRQSTRPSSHYNTLNTEDICRLPVSSLAAAGSYLFLWCTNRHLLQGDARQVCEAWGFRPITTMAWLKTMGLGYYIRNAHENVLFGVRGRPGQFKKKDMVSYFGKRTKRHSEKPAYFYRMLEEYIDGPYLELFAREKRSGWTCWGDEIGDPFGIGFNHTEW